MALLSANGDTLSQWKGSARFQSLPIPKNQPVKYIDVECDGLVYGYAVSFVKKGQMDPDAVVYPSDLTATPNPWNSEMTLKWKANDISSLNVTQKNYDGRYDIYRDGTKIGSVGGGTGSNYSYIDGDIEFGKKYSYQINYIPKTWTDTIPTPCLTTTTSATMQHTVSITDFHGSAISDGYSLSWRLDCNLNQTTGYSFKLYRIEMTADKAVPTAEDFKGLEPIREVAVTSTQPSNYTTTDKTVNSTSSYDSPGRTEHYLHADLYARRPSRQVAPLRHVGFLRYLYQLCTRGMAIPCPDKRLVALQALPPYHPGGRAEHQQQGAVRQCTFAVGLHHQHYLG